MKKTSIIFLCFVIAGCSSLKNDYSNFTAYYNTFYNAKKDFKAGLKKVNQQPVSIDGQTLVRAHRKTAPAGSEDFNNAIDNGAQILRRFPETKWTDNALLLMGKSYYYLQEDFLAIQKFEELLALQFPSPLKQQAVIWKGRTLLDIEAYSRGVQFLEGALQDFEGKWNPQFGAETQILLAEHLAMLGQWAKAANRLQPALLQLNDGALKGRGYLLLGQIFEKQNDYDRAFQAYFQVQRNYPDYEYIYWAGIKKAEVSRLAGKEKMAASIYNSMLNDDKNFNRRDEINYRLAQIFQDRGNFKDAEAIYNEILKNPSGNDPENIAGDIYNQLGHIYSEHYHDFEVAAAYFDSSSAQSTEEAKNGAGKLASAYGRYVSLKHEIVEKDSLLALGSLSAGELNTRLIEIRKHRRQNLQNSQNRVQLTNNTLANAGREDVYETPGPNAGTSRFGFLNYHNRELVRQNRQKFTAIWGDRPLVDNWRRRQVITHAVLNDEEDSSTQTRDLQEEQNGNLTDKQLGINTANIPRTAQSRERLNREKLLAQYRLGSLFFLTLNRPDSAAYYYHQILRQPGSSDLQVQTLYSLYELYNLQNRADSSALYRNKIMRQYPHSRYASRIAAPGDSGGADSLRDESTSMLRQKVQQILQATPPDSSSEKMADKLLNLAVQNKTSALAPSIYYRAIRAYIKAAKQRDSVGTSTDSLAAAVPGRSATFPYKGPGWERLREVLNKFEQLFPDAPQNRQVDIWLETLQNPGDVLSMLSCQELHAEPVIVSGKNEFIRSVSLPQKVKKMNLSGSIAYRFTIGRDGSVQSYTRVSNPTHLGIEEAYEKAIKNGLRFQPITQNGRPVRASCVVSFPIKQ